MRAETTHTRTFSFPLMALRVSAMEQENWSAAKRLHFTSWSYQLRMVSGSVILVSSADPEEGETSLRSRLLKGDG